MLRILIAAALIAFGAHTIVNAPVFAQDEAKPEKEDDKKKDEAKPAKKEEPKTFTREFSGTFGGTSVNYVVTAGETFLKNDKGEDIASIFTTAYTKKGVDDPRTRPVTFVFNGGPGSASLWLHMGVFGPKRVVVPSDGKPAGAAPYDVTDNPLSILDVTDLVFIDPVGTGYSIPLGKAKGEDFWGLKEDADSIAQFIRIWITKNGRWNSAKYISGESYGTTRAARLVSSLQRNFNGITVNGVILISSILDFHTADFNKGNDMPYVGFLPGYAATAWFHDKVDQKPASLDAFVQEARDFAVNEYSVALLKGSKLKEDERKAIIAKLARFTGLSETYLDQADMRVDAMRFMKQLLRDRGQTVGRFDSRYIGKDYDDAGERFENDPSGYGIDGAYVTAVNDYLTRVLKVNFDRRYRILEGEPQSKWKWSEDKSGWATHTNVAPHLGIAMRENADFRVYQANGYYDLATPFFATELTMANNGIDAARVTMSSFEAGHMLYTHEPSLQRLATEVRAFIKAGR
jgi:carboxypeptidase C (cathepsin A)